MVAGKQLATGCVEKTTPVPSDGNHKWMARRGGGFPIRNIMKLCSAVESRVPLGYEDEGGFHYGVNLADSFFSI